MEGKGLGSIFSRSAKADPIGDMGAFGGMLVDMILWGPLAAFMNDCLSTVTGAAGVFNEAAASGVLEAASILSDQDVEKRRGRRLSDYPEGRQPHVWKNDRTARKFNLVSSGHNSRFSFDAKAELACMHELLEMLGMLENDGAETLKLDQRISVYDSLKYTARRM